MKTKFDYKDLEFDHNRTILPTQRNKDIFDQLEKEFAKDRDQVSHKIGQQIYYTYLGMSGIFNPNSENLFYTSKESAFYADIKREMIAQHDEQYEIDKLMDDEGVDKREAPRLLLAIKDGFIRGHNANFFVEGGFHVTLAWDGVKALEKIKSRLYEVVIVDFSLDLLSGLRVCEIIKNNSLPVGLLALYSFDISDTLMDTANELGLDIVLSPDQEPQNFPDMLKKLLDEKGIHRPKSEYVPDKGIQTVYK